MIPDIPIQKIKAFFLTIGEGALELIVSLGAMILVERFRGQNGLGIFSYLLSVFFIAGYLAEFGMSRYAEREMALHDGNPETQSVIIRQVFQAMCFTGILCAGLFMFSAGYDAAYTRVEERVAAYMIIGLAIPFRNLNRLKFSVLHGYGSHEAVAVLKTKKRLLFLGTIFFLLLVRVPPSYLSAGFLITEIILAVMLLKKIRFPRMRVIRSGQNRFWENISDSLRHGYSFLLTDETLDIVLYMDFFILGFFVPSWELGVYAEASVLARFFLLIPVSIKPIFRRQYNLLASQNNFAQASRFMQQTTSVLFYLHSVFALYIMLFFPEILNMFFHVRGEELVSYRIFTIIIPGLLLFSAITAQDPVYEASDRIDNLKHLVLAVSVINLVLSFYLIPYARFFGAAAAAMISMTVYFFLFGRGLKELFIIQKRAYLSAGAGIYLIYVLMQYIEPDPKTGFFLIPITVFLVFWFMGFFYVEPVREQ